MCSTWAPPAAACGNPRIPAIAGPTPATARSVSRPWAPSPWPTATPTSSMPAAVHPRFAATSRSGAASGNRWMAPKPGRSSACATLARFQPSASTRPILMKCSWPAPATPLLMARIAASIAPATAARRGPRYFSSTRRWAQPIWSWRPTIRKPFMPPCGTASAGRGPSPPAARMAASTSLSMAATRGPSWRAVCQTACSGAPISACPPRRRTGSMP